jgi:DNA-binding GntR family transcriptional regulator
MLSDPAWTSYLSARQTALRCCADPTAAAISIGRAEARLQAYLGMGPEQASAHARRSFLFAADAAFHDQLLASSGADLLRTIVAQTRVDDFRLRGIERAARSRSRCIMAPRPRYFRFGSPWRAGPE